MTGLLQEALRRVESLSREEQDAIASRILETLDDEEAWAGSFRDKGPAADPWLARRWRGTVVVKRGQRINS